MIIFGMQAMTLPFVQLHFTTVYVTILSVTILYAYMQCDNRTVYLHVVGV